MMGGRLKVGPRGCIGPCRYRDIGLRVSGIFVGVSSIFEDYGICWFILGVPTMTSKQSFLTQSLP